MGVEVALEILTSDIGGVLSFTHLSSLAFSLPLPLSVTSQHRERSTEFGYHRCVRLLFRALARHKTFEIIRRRRRRRNAARAHKSYQLSARTAISFRTVIIAVEIFANNARRISIMPFTDYSESSG